MTMMMINEENIHLYEHGLRALLPCSFDKRLKCTLLNHINPLFFSNIYE